MAHIEVTTTKSPNRIADLVELLWAGKISEDTFVREAHQLGASVARIEWEIEHLKQADGIL